MIARADKRRRANAGFSLTEALVTLAILVMVSAIMATAVPSAYKAYQHLVDASNAHLLLSTTTTRLRDELSVADPATIVTDEAELADAEALVQFESLETGFVTTLKFGPSGATDGRALLYLEERVKGADSPLSPPRLLVPKKGGAGAGSELVARLTGVSYADGVFTVEGLQITRVEADTEVVAGAQVSNEEGTATDLRIRVLAGSAS